MNNLLVYFWDYSGWAYNCEVSWAIGNDLVYLRVILVGAMIMIVFWSYLLVGL